MRSTARHLLRSIPFAFVLMLAAGCGGQQDWDARFEQVLRDEQGSAEEKIKQLEAFLKEGPPEDVASETRFAIAWIYSETLHHYPEARRWFEELVTHSPEGPWADQARWMLENMEKDPADLLPPDVREALEPPPPGDPRP